MANCLAYCFKTYFHQSSNKALHRTAIPLRSIAAGERCVSRNHMGTAVMTKGTRLDMIFL